MIPDDIKKYLDLIDGKYADMKGKVSRMSIEWGTWSREMNLEIRGKLKKKDPNSTLLKYIYNYWVNRSQLLELYFSKKYHKQATKKKLGKEGKELKKIIMEGNPPDIKNPWSRTELRKLLMKKRPK